VSKHSDDEPRGTSRVRTPAASLATEPSEAIAKPAIIRDGLGRFQPGSGKPARRRRGGQVGNLNATRSSPWMAFWRRRALRSEDRWAERIASEVAGSLLADKPEPSSASLRAMELAGVARGCGALVLDALRRDGGVDGPRGVLLLGALANFAKLELQALKCLGFERAAKPAESLQAYFERVSSEREAAEEAAQAAAEAQGQPSHEPVDAEQPADDDEAAADPEPREGEP
jgi:hypothetical protein